ncbi:glycoside hydrolase family 2 TIM barrel-domain containing protein [Roseivirga misakiensis]|uniref:Beta-galactosidase n=1 Tax=Roseivirga misakiensis TaxID=1563681 RepID=A0A1E5SZI4_9BACT|nr:glycoside hydrolase family 2 TIM barrel-domain containing protein [Roseivirga misakiensis]OEK04532.1 beta-galactosidase [Roseivirga misakiensis]
MIFKSKPSFKSLLILFTAIIFLGCQATKDQEDDTVDISKSEIRQTAEGYQLFVNDEPFYIQGAGLEFGSIPKLAAHGANSFRTWRTDNGQRSGKEVLDDALKYGLKVTMGIDVGRERLGFDYDDEAAVKAQLERIRGEVMELKDHPALIIWGIGNELNHHSENPKVWDAVNEISKMIHEVDPNHLTTTSLAGMNKEYVDLIKERAPDLDVLSVQMYAEVEILPEQIKKSGWEGPMMVTEWGATGYWEVGNTEWGAPLENNSSVKADFYRSRFRKAIESQKKQVIGSYVFLWGQKQERTPTWFGMFMPDGRETESIDAMHYIWNGEWPDNRTPRINDFKLESQVAENNIKLKSGKSYQAMVDVVDPDGDPLTYRWEIMKESTTNATGGDAEEVPEVIEGLIKSEPGSDVTFSAPMEEGAYRLFIYVDDNNEHTAHANIPFFVNK